MQTFADLIAKWDSTADFAKDLKIPYPTAAAWKQRNSIPPDRWEDVRRAAKARGVTVSDSQLLAFRAKRVALRKAS